MMRWSCLILILTASLCSAQQTDEPRQIPQRLEQTIQQEVALNYLLALPEGYDEDPEAEWPLVIFLHGIGERGEDLEKVKSWGPAKRIEQGHTFPAIVVSPQCPPDGWWPHYTRELILLLDDLEATHRIDKDRIYITGLSMGGFGTWSLIAAIPDRIAAAVPVCGGTDLFSARTIGKNHVPVWAFHGEIDTVVPVEESLRATQTLRASGNRDARLTIYSGVGHNAWTPTYNDQNMWDWLFSKRLSDRAKEDAPR